ncbi:MAG: WecB/TagA/CpsF family glycosyltransferase [Acidimicrobiales bacterium]|nr:WecB/TagA/CpsF family glycosyltransferase [Acidimicrobiales bacterium]
MWISRVQGTPLPERVGGIDMFEHLAGRAAEADRSLFLVGGQGTAAADAAAILVERHPGLRIAGAFSPPMGLAGDEARLHELVDQVEAAQPDIIAVGLPSMLQIDLAERFGAVLPSAWVLGVGVSFSFVTGEVSRAPRWVQRAGLEWIHRMLQQPDLMKRYLVHDAPLALKLLANAAITRIRPGAAS